MNFLAQFLQTLFSGVSPVTLAKWVRGLIGAVFGGVSTGVVDVLMQLLAEIQQSDAIVIDWRLVLRTMAAATIPSAIAWFKHTEAQTERERTIVAASLPEGATLRDVDNARTTAKENEFRITE